MLNALSQVTRYAALFSGNRFYPFNPIGMALVSRIELSDIAHSLSNICRFNGHCSEFYSVAQHCVHVASLVEDDKLRFAALMHDASECYIGDVVSPFKKMFEGLVRLEHRVQKEINERFGIVLTEEDERLIKRADWIALATEKRDLMPKQRFEQWSYLKSFEADPVAINPLPPKEAKALFLETFHSYSHLGFRKAA